MTDTCKICGDNQWVVAYQGDVRHGVYGRYVPGTVYLCQGCDVAYLPPMAEDLANYYQSGEYREDVGESPDIQHYFERHDRDQLGKYAFLEPLPVRGKVIADVGCAGGSFLDGLVGFASTTVGIEPAFSYHNSLRNRGHQVYSDLTDALSTWEGQVDIATCFSVIEHIDDPVPFLRDIRKLLTDNGVLLLSTPNRRDILLELGGTAYQSFFYRTVHVYYFDEISLKTTAKIAGFSDTEAKYVHRFNFSNFTKWLQEAKPTGNTGQTSLGPAFDRVWKTMLETQGSADYLYAYLQA